MTPFEWIFVAVAVLALAGLLVFCRLGKKPAFSVEAANCLVKATENERRDWVVRLDTRLANNTSSRLNVKEVTFFAEAPRGARVEPKRVTGDKSKVVRHRGHGPDLAMRLPIELGSSRETAFTFDVFFPHSLQSHFGEVILRADFRTEEGPSAALRMPIQPA